MHRLSTQHCVAMGFPSISWTVCALSAGYRVHDSATRISLHIRKLQPIGYKSFVAFCYRHLPPSQRDPSEVMESASASGGSVLARSLAGAGDLPWSGRSLSSTPEMSTVVTLTQSLLNVRAI